MKVGSLILSFISFKFKRDKSILIKISWFLFLLLFLFGLAVAQNISNQSDFQSKEKSHGLKPGQKVLIGIISPELEELLLSGQKKEIPAEMEEEKPLSEEEIAEAKKRLAELEKKKNILSGDFYGLNQLGQRYAMIFDRLGYIRFHIAKINEEIAEIKKKIKNN